MLSRNIKQPSYLDGWPINKCNGVQRFLLVSMLSLAIFVGSCSQREIPSASSSSSSCCQTDACHQYSQILSQHMDLSVSPCYNFHWHVCGKWNRNLERTDVKNLEEAQILIVQNLLRYLKRDSKTVNYVIGLLGECDNEIKREQLELVPMAKLLKRVLGEEKWSLDGRDTLYLFTIDENNNEIFNEKSVDYSSYDQQFNNSAQTTLFASGNGISETSELNFRESLKSWKKSKVVDHPDVHQWMDSYVEAALIDEYLVESIVEFDKGIQISWSKLIVNDQIDNLLYKMSITFKERLWLFYNQNEWSTSLESAIFEVLDFYSKLADIYKQKPTRVNNSSTIVQMITLDELNRNYSSPHFDWTLLLNKFANRTGASFRFTDQDKVSVQMDELDSIRKFTELFARTPIRVLKNSLGLQTLKYKFLLDRKYRLDKQSPQRSVCILESIQEFPSVYTRLFVESVGIEQMQIKRDHMIKMARQIKYIFADSLANLQKYTWLDNQTRQNAQNKLKAMKGDIAFPDWIFEDNILDEKFGFDKSNTTEEQFVIGEYATSFVNLIRMKSSAQFRNSRVNETNQSNKREFFFNFENPAAYFNHLNLFEISAVKLSEQFKVDYPASIKYGIMGSIIGHEIIHAFGGKSRLFDQNGKKANWWSDFSNRHYVNRSECFVRQYDQLVEPITRVLINGTYTLDENIADNGGLKLAYQAFEKHLKQSNNSCSTQQLPSFLAQFTPEQLFFISHASHYCSYVIKNHPDAIYFVRNDNHSPGNFRVNAPLSNIQHATCPTVQSLQVSYWDTDESEIQMFTLVMELL